MELHEVTLTHDPAYTDTSIALRSKPILGIKSHDLGNGVLWLETC